MYLQNPPQQYRPNIHSPAVDWDQYRIHSEKEPSHLSDVLQDRVASSHSNIPALGHSTVHDDLTLTEQHLMNMGLRPRPQEVSVPVNLSEILPLIQGVRGNINSVNPEPSSLNPNLEEITQALNVLKNTLPPDHPDILNLTQAAQSMGWQGGLQEDLASNQNLAASYQVEHTLSMQGYDIPDRDTVSAYEQIRAQPAQEIQTLEQVVQQEFWTIQENTNAELSDPMASVQAAMNEINQTMQQAMQPLPPEEDPLMQYRMMLNYQMQGMMPGGFGPTMP
jgi:hypothetical protein